MRIFSLAFLPLGHLIAYGLAPTCSSLFRRTRYWPGSTSTITIRPPRLFRRLPDSLSICLSPASEPADRARSTEHFQLSRTAPANFGLRIPEAGSVATAICGLYGPLRQIIHNGIPTALSWRVAFPF